MKISNGMMAAALLMGTGSQVLAALTDDQYRVVHEELQGCLVSAGSCYDQTAGQYVFTIQDKSTCSLVGLDWKSPVGMKSWNTFKLASIAKTDAIDQSLKQVMLARVAPGAYVSRTAMDALFNDDTVSYDDYVRCRESSREYVYLYGKPADIAAKMANAESVGLRFEPSTPLVLPDVLKVDPVISNDFEIPETSPIAVQMALAGNAAKTVEEAKVIAQQVEVNLQDARRRRRRLAGLEEEAEDTVKVEAKSHRILEAVGFEVEDMLLGGEYLSALNDVKFVQLKPTFTFTNFDAGLYIQSETSLANGASTNVNEATTRPLWAAGIDGTNQVVGVGDTGLDYNSCFFSDGSVSVPSGQVTNFPNHRKLAQYWAFTSNREDTTGGHGSHVSGTVAGDPNSGSTLHRGVAYKARIALADLSSNGQSVNTPNELGDMFDASKQVNAFLHTNSWGTASNNMDLSARQVDEYQWENQEYLTLFAAGNSGYSSSGTVGSPAVSKNCVTVGAQLNSDRSWGSSCPNSESPCSRGMASFSSSGPVYDGRIAPDVVAYGHRVSSARSSTSGSSCTTMAISGTSMATPAVAGAAALVRQFFTDGYYPTGSPSGNGFTPMGSLVKAVLINSGNFLDGRYGTRSLNGEINNYQGFGSVSLGSILPVGNSIAADNGRTIFVVGDNSDRLNINGGDLETFGFQVTDDNVNTFKVTLVWSDPPASVSASTALVNNVDLEVITPSGVQLYPNQRSSPDNVNVVEQVTIDASDVETGTYTVRIRGVSIPQGPQPVSLVVTGKFSQGPTPPPVPTTPTPEPTQFPTPTVTECQDVDGWYDSDGPTYDCAWYAVGTRCATYGDGYENFGYTANEACCACKEAAGRSKDFKTSGGIDTPAQGEQGGAGIAYIAGGAVGGMVVGAAAMFAVNSFRNKNAAQTTSLDSFSEFRVSGEGSTEANNQKV